MPSFTESVIQLGGPAYPEGGGGFYRVKGHLIRVQAAPQGRGVGGKYDAAPRGVAVEIITTKGSFFCRLPGGSGERPFFQGLPACPAGNGGFYGTPATDTAGALRLGNTVAVTELGMEASRHIRSPGIRPLAGCRAVIGIKCNGYGV